MDAIDIFLFISYGLFIGSIIAILLLSIFNGIKEPKTLVKTGVALAGFLILFFISYSMSSDEVTTKYASLGVGSGSSKLIGGALITMYIVLIASLVILAYNEVSKLFK
jgi:hypothetical protein